VTKLSDLLPFLRMVTLLVLAGLASGCSLFCPLCLPVPEVDKDGLGLSPIGDYIRMHTWVGKVNEAGLKDGLADLIAQRTSPNGLSREDAESLGVQCAPAPGAECVFLGERSYRINPWNLPRDDPKYGKRAIQKVEVRFSYLKPQALVVKASEYVIQAE